MAGTYVSKLADSDSDRDIVEIFTKDKQHLLTTFIAVSQGPANGTIVTFEEEPQGLHARFVIIDAQRFAYRSNRYV
jgi:hypothetical protein